jgi:hypothetical protein
MFFRNVGCYTTTTRRHIAEDDTLQNLVAYNCEFLDIEAL